MRQQHATMRRLYEAAAELQPPITGQSELARKVGHSPQAVNNWETRGVSAAGANTVQKVLGISSTWIMEGREPRYLSTAVTSLNPLQLAERQRRLMAAAIQLLRHIEANVVEPIPAERFDELVDLITAEIIEYWADGLDPAELTTAGRRVLTALRTAR